MDVKVCDVCKCEIRMFEEYDYSMTYKSRICSYKLELCPKCNKDLRTVIKTKRIREHKFDKVKKLFNRIRGRGVEE